jgi:hypothetical protein
MNFFAMQTYASPQQRSEPIILKNLFEIANILHCKSGLLKTNHLLKNFE